MTGGVQVVIEVAQPTTDQATFGVGPFREAVSSEDVAPCLVTVVIPARNEEAHLESCIRSVVGQIWQNMQIIVVDGASRDRTAEIARRWGSIDSRVELLHNDRCVIPVSLNLALAVARGCWLVRVDAHSTIPANYVNTVVEHLRSGQWGGVGGRKDGEGQTAAGRAIALTMGSRFGVGNSTYHYGRRKQPVEHIPFGSYPVELLRAVGGWDESLRVNQDFELDYRLRSLGKSLLFDPDLVIHWKSKQRLADLFTQYRRYGAGKVAVARKHPHSLRARHLAAPALVATLTFSAGIAAWRPRLAAILVAPYVVSITTASTGTAMKLSDLRSRVFVAPAFLAMHLGWGLGFWSGLVTAVRASIAVRRGTPRPGRRTELPHLPQ